MSSIAKRSINHNGLEELTIRLAIKLFCAIAFLTLALATLILSLSPASASPTSATPYPRGDVMVQGKDVKLGDVFEGLGKHADFVLAPAPKPGEELVWNAPTLLRIATAFNLPWRPQQQDAVRIRRAATLVDSETLKVILREYLASRNIAQDDGTTDTYTIKLTSDVPEIVVPSLDTPQIIISDFSMPESGGSFSAIVKIATSQAHVETVTLRGMAERMLRLPVLKKGLSAGNIIRETDISWIVKPANAVNRSILRDSALIIGTTPRKSIPAGVLLTENDIQKPMMVGRGEMVTMVYDKDGMYLTAKGRALEDGVMGQIIRIMNESSSRQIEAKVTSAREVRVQ